VRSGEAWRICHHGARAQGPLLTAVAPLLAGCGRPSPKRSILGGEVRRDLRGGLPTRSPLSTGTTPTSAPSSCAPVDYSTATRDKSAVSVTVECRQNRTTGGGDAHVRVRAARLLRLSVWTRVGGLAGRGPRPETVLGTGRGPAPSTRSRPSVDVCALGVSAESLLTSLVK
jgi:hypothetical protein